MELNIKLLNLL